MSHFSVLVVGNDIEKQLAPYQENNCDDCPKEYLEFNDVEEEYRKKYENDTIKEFYCASNCSRGMEISSSHALLIDNISVGEKTTLIIEKEIGLFQYYEKDKQYNCYYRKEYESNAENQLPKIIRWIKVTKIISTSHLDPTICFTGIIEVEKINPPKEIPIKEIYPDGFETFIEDWAGYERDKENGKYGYWENLNKKWDWYQVGGRWAGSLLIKKELINEIQNSECGFKLNQPNFSWGWDDEKKEKILKKPYVDQAIKKYIDIDGMEKPMKDEATKIYDEWHSKFKKMSDSEEKQKWIHENLGFFVRNIDIDRLNNMTHDEYVACKSVWSSYALLWNGKWYEKGEMGWFGISINEENNWKGQFKELWNEIPDDELVTMIDCHI